MVNCHHAEIGGTEVKSCMGVRESRSCSPSATRTTHPLGFIDSAPFLSFEWHANAFQRGHQKRDEVRSAGFEDLSSTFNAPRVHRWWL